MLRTERPVLAFQHTQRDAASDAAERSSVTSCTWVKLDALSGTRTARHLRHTPRPFWVRSCGQWGLLDDLALKESAA
jgi:hypothetical protein